MLFCTDNTKSKIVQYQVPFLLLAIASVYVVLGAAIFSYIEVESPSTNELPLQASKDLLNASDILKISLAEWMSSCEQCREAIDKIDQDLGSSTLSDIFQTIALNISSLNRSNSKTAFTTSRDIVEEDDWSFGSAVLFTFSIVTTIGYGHVAPSTGLGQVFCVFYSFIGIPIGMLAIANIGRFFSDASKKAYVFVVIRGRRLVCLCRRLAKKFREKHHILQARYKYRSHSSMSYQNEKDIDIATNLGIGNGYRHSLDPVMICNSAVGSPQSSREGTSKQADKGVIEVLLLTRDGTGSPATSVGSTKQDVPIDGTKMPAGSQDKMGMEQSEDKEKFIDINNNSDGNDDSEEVLYEIDRLPAPLVAGLFFTWVLVGSALLPMWEKMNFGEALYFSVISLTTVGFGDFYPSNHLYLVPTFIYILMGLVLTTMAIDVFAEYLQKLHYLGRSIKDVAGAYVWIGGKRIAMKDIMGGIVSQLELDEEKLAAAMANMNSMLGEAVEHADDPDFNWSSAMPISQAQMQHDDPTLPFEKRGSDQTFRENPFNIEVDFIDVISTTTLEERSNVTNSYRRGGHENDTLPRTGLGGIRSCFDWSAVS